jgi:uncharacterized Zn finger protein (UPF0148 family)
MCTSTDCQHDDLNDDVFDIFGITAPANVTKPIAVDTVLADAQIANTRRFEETCPACNGSGVFRGYTGRIVGDCFKCDGKGVRFFKTSSDDRAKARDAAAAKREAAAATAVEQANAWLEANPVEAAWMREPIKGDFTFHADMLEALNKYGHLTERQEAAVRNAAAKSAARKAQWAAEKAARDAAAPVLTMGKIRAGFDNATQYLKRPKLRIADIQFSLAPATGVNAGAIYVVRASDDTYLGSDVVARVAADPAAAASAHGHEYGYCSCCGRELTNPESVARGIGPICAERWGW